MAYVRKTIDTWEVQSCYNGTWEMVTTENTKKEAFARLKEYRVNAPMSYRIKKVRERI